MNNAILTVWGNDRPGIIANVTELLFKTGCNLEDLSMTILEGEFAMMLIMAYPVIARKKIDRQIAVLEKTSGLSISFKPLVRKILKRGESYGLGTQSYLISVIGKDRTGIVYKVSSALAQLGLNITDLNCRILGKSKSILYLMMLEVDIPKRQSKQMIQTKLQKLARQLKMEIQIRPTERLML